MTLESRTERTTGAGATPVTKEQHRPLAVGLRAARANLVPALLIQAAVVTVVLAYYFWEPARTLLARLAEFKRDGGYLFSLVSGMVAGGLLPELLTVAVFQKWRVSRENLSSLAFGACFWGLMALVVDLFAHINVDSHGCFPCCISFVTSSAVPLRTSSTWLT